MASIRNPVEWTAEQIRMSARYVGSASRSVGGAELRSRHSLPAVRQISLADLREVLARGVDDFMAFRTDVVFICILYPVIGVVLSRLAFRHELVPLLFPMASGFALVGPAAAVFLYEMSRMRERGETVTWGRAFRSLGRPGFASLVILGLMLAAVFLLWLIAAQAIYSLTLGPEPPAGLDPFIRDIFTTAAGWTMLIAGLATGALFAVLVLATSVVSFPLLLDRDVGVRVAVLTSVRVVGANPGPMLAWGAIVAGGLLLGSIPLFVGLIVVMPILGHSTWHLYRKVCAPSA
jgi:uncharacterized membrane protein